MIRNNRIVAFSFIAMILSFQSFLYSSDIQFGGELRLRPEYRGNPDFNDATNESNSFVGSRLRITGQGPAADNVSVKVTFQDTRNWGEEAGTASGLTDTGEAVDIHEGYVDFKNFLNSPLKLRAGRQELVFGDQRLIGNFGWSNQGRAFDAFRLTYDTTFVSADLFTAKRKENNGTTASSPSSDRDFSGIYSTWKKIVPQSIIDLYVLQDREGDTISPAKSRNIVTAGVRLAGKASQFDFGVEAPFQFGEAGTIIGTSSDNVKVSAHALAAKAGLTLPGEKEIRIGLEYDFASGDDNASDDKAKTFNNLYPTNHSHYGFMDNQGWRNLNAWNVSVSARPSKRVYTLASLWQFNLAEEKDGWYNAAGSSSGALRAPSSTNTEDEVGQELDLLVRFSQDANITWEAGLSRFFAGDFINHRVTNEDDSNWAYVMTTVKF